MELGVALLLLVALFEGPGFGLELIARVHRRSEGRIRLNRGGTYLALRKLERQGAIRGWMRSTGASGRPRRYYELTPRGIAEAERARAVLKGLVDSRRHRVSSSEAHRMADRVVRSGQLSALSLRLRTAARRAGIR